MKTINEKFEQYLNQQLSVEDYLEFQKKLETDEDLFQAFQDYILAKKTGEVLLKEKIKRQAENSINDYKKEKWQKKIGGNTRFFIWGLVAILAMTGIYFFIKNSTPPPPVQNLSPKEIAQNNYLNNQKIEKDLIAPLQNLSTSDSLKNDALAFLRLKNYPEAIEIINQIPINDGDFQRMQLVKGLCLIYQNNFEEAESVIQNVQNTTSNIYLLEEAQWLLVLNYLKFNRNLQIVENLLQEIKITSNHKYQADAENLLKKFN